MIFVLWGSRDLGWISEWGCVVRIVQCHQFMRILFEATKKTVGAAAVYYPGFHRPLLSIHEREDQIVKGELIKVATKRGDPTTQKAYERPSPPDTRRKGMRLKRPSRKQLGDILRAFSNTSRSLWVSSKESFLNFRCWVPSSNVYVTPIPQVQEEANWH